MASLVCSQRALFRRLEHTYPFVGELVRASKYRVRMHALCAHREHVDNMEYTLAGTPCANVVSNRSMRHIPMGIWEKTLELRIERYLGFQITDALGNVIGLLVLMHDESMLDSHRRMSIDKSCSPSRG